MCISENQCWEEFDFESSSLILRLLGAESPALNRMIFNEPKKKT